MGCSDINTISESPDYDVTVLEDSNDESLDDSSKYILPKPPSLTVYVGEEPLSPTLGTYSWIDETGSGIEADSVAPPELVKNNNPMSVTVDTNIELEFDEQPASYTVRIWEEDHNIKSESNKVVLSDKGRVIYEVLAHWEQGVASYAFALNIE